MPTQTKQAGLICRDNQLLPTGHLDFNSVSAVYEASLAFLHNQSSFVIDFTDVRSSNSAGLALIVEWIKLAKQTNCQIRFVNIPENLLLIAKVADLTDVL